MKKKLLSLSCIENISLYEKFANNQYKVSNLTDYELNKYVVDSNNILGMITTSIESLILYLEKDLYKSEFFLNESLKNQLVACELMKMLINKIIFSSNSLEPKLKAINIILLIEKSINIMNTLFVSNNNSYIFECSINKNKLYLTDESWISMIIINFLINAKKNTKNGCITIKIYELDNKIRIEIIDTGKGVDIDKRATLFKKNKNTAKSNKLYTIHKMCIALKGNCGYKQNIHNNNQGSIFWIELPLISSKLQIEFNIPVDISKYLKVIVCDDSKVMADIFINYIEKQIPYTKVYATYTIKDLLISLEKIKNESLIIVILDIYLENDMSLNYLDLIKNANKNVGIIIHTGSTMLDNEIIQYTNSINLPFSIMHKPASLDVIKTNISNILEMLGCVNILIIEDDKIKSDTIKDIYTQMFYNVFLANNIDEARKILFKMNGTPLIIFFSTNIINTINKDIIQEFFYINSYKCKTDNNPVTNTDVPFIFDKIINDLSTSTLQKVLKESLVKHSNR
jgi:response regulator of citrate/malate metabolism